MKNKLSLSEKIKVSRRKYPRPRFPGNTSGNLLVACLYQECLLRGSNFKEMAKELNVTYGYINQLRTGVRSVERISQKMVEACACYLSIPIFSVKVASGQIKMSDFDCHPDTEETTVESSIIEIFSGPDFGKKLLENMQSAAILHKNKSSPN